MDLVTNKCPEVPFALDEEALANPRESVRPVFRHFQGELLHFRAVDQHKSSSPMPLYLSWERTHSCCSMSCRAPRYTG